MDERSERVARWFEIPVTIAALLVIPIVLFQDPDSGDAWNTLGNVLDWISWLTFASEIVVMLAVVPDRRRWLRGHLLELAVVVLTPPVLTNDTSFRLLRLLRLLWLFRLAPLAKKLFTTAGLRSAALLAVLTAIVGGSAFAELQKGQTTADGIYWAITTMTTVGYGNPSPTNTSTKILAVFVIVVGIGFVAVMTGAIAQRFLAPDIAEEESEFGRIEASNDQILTELREIRARLESLEGGRS